MILLPFALNFEESLPHLSSPQLIAYLYLSFSTLLSYALWFRGLVFLPQIATSTLGLLSPITAVILGWLFLGQNLNDVAFIGFSIVLLSLVFIQVKAVR